MSKRETGYVKPEEVVSPKRRWQLIAVLYDGGAKESALAIGRWEGRFVVAMRWNGDGTDNHIGNPQSRGIATWFIVPHQFTTRILFKLGRDKRLLALSFLMKQEAAHLITCKLTDATVYLKQSPLTGMWFLDRLESDDHTVSGSATGLNFATKESFLPELREAAFETPQQAVDALVTKYPGLS